MVKKWYRSRMLWANLGAIVTGIGVFFETGDPTVLFPSALGLFNVVMRLVTKTALTK